MFLRFATLVLFSLASLQSLATASSDEITEDEDTKVTFKVRHIPQSLTKLWLTWAPPVINDDTIFGYNFGVYFDEAEDDPPHWKVVDLTLANADSMSREFKKPNPDKRYKFRLSVWTDGYEHRGKAKPKFLYDIIKYETDEEK